MIRIFSVFILIVIALSAIMIGSEEGVNFSKFTPFSDANKTCEEIILSGDMPTIRASVAFYPLASIITENTYNPKTYNGECQYLSTFDSYNSIINNDADIAICSETSSSQQAILNS